MSSSDSSDEDVDTLLMKNKIEHEKNGLRTAQAKRIVPVLMKADFKLKDIGFVFFGFV